MRRFSGNETSGTTQALIAIGGFGVPQKSGLFTLTVIIAAAALVARDLLRAGHGRDRYWAAQARTASGSLATTAS